MFVSEGLKSQNDAKESQISQFSVAD